jgi:NADH-quinone oxidoreductase subunit J
MVQVAFFAGAIGALGGAIAVITLRNAFYSVLALIVHLVSLAGLFLLLHAEFVAAAQVVVYAGAIVVLYVFVAAYIGGVEESLWEPIRGQRLLAPLFAAALFVVLSIAILGTGLAALGERGPEIPLGFGSPSAIGTLLLERFLLVFEVVSLILLVAAVAAVVLAGRRRAEAAESTAGDAELAVGPAPSAPEPAGSGREAEHSGGGVGSGREAEHSGGGVG